MIREVPYSDRQHLLPSGIILVVEHSLPQIRPEGRNIVRGFVGQSRLELLLGVEDILLQEVLSDLDAFFSVLEFLEHGCILILVHVVGFQDIVIVILEQS